MKKLVLLFALGLWTGAWAREPRPATRAVPVAATLAHRLPAVPPPAPSPRYDVRGIFDPELGGIIAFALKVPHGWLMQQSFTRQYDRGMHANKIFLSLTSPDKQRMITLLPEKTYAFFDSPAARQVRASMPQPDPTALGPLLPLDYLKRVVLPFLNQQPAYRLRVTAEHGDPPKDLGHGAQQASGYVEGMLPSGHKVRIQTDISLVTRTGEGSSATDWNALTSVVESSAPDLAATLALFEGVGKSLVANPAWLKKENELRQRGIQQYNAQAPEAMRQSIAATAAERDRQMQRFHQNEANYQAQRSALNQNFQNHMRAGSQAANATADYMGDQTLYQNPATGERTKLQSGYSHVYQDQQGTTLSTNAPLSPGQVNWQELQQVELKNY